MVVFAESLDYLVAIVVAVFFFSYVRNKGLIIITTDKSNSKTILKIDNRR